MTYCTREGTLATMTSSFHIQETSRVTLRPAESDDAGTLLGWRNLPQIVALGSSRRMVTEEEHGRWFAQVLRDANRRLYIILIDGVPAGQLRLEPLPGGEGELSVFLIPCHTGLGHGVDAIRQGCQRLFEELPVRTIVAFVRESNHRSLSAFQKAGFATDPRGEQRAHHLRLERSK
jgi:RimJ/RimL family protein N-acetyltransferase